MRSGATQATGRKRTHGLRRVGALLKALESTAVQLQCRVMPLTADAQDYCENLFRHRRAEAEQEQRRPQGDPGNNGVAGDNGEAEARIALMRELARGRADCLRFAYEWQGDRLSKQIIGEIVRDVDSFVDMWRAAYLSTQAAVRTKGDGPTRRNYGTTTAYLEELSTHLERTAASIHDEILNSLTARMYADLKWERKSAVEPKPLVCINLSGPSARLNIQSTDNSITVANVTPEQFFNQLRRELQQVRDEPERMQALARLDTLEQAQDPKVFLDQYTEPLATAANQMPVLAPFLPGLAQILLDRLS